MTRTGNQEPVAASARTAPSASPPGAGVSVARQRLLTDLLAWGAPRPRVSSGFAARLRSALEERLAPLREELAAVVARADRGPLLITRSRVRRAVCDGWHLDPLPYRYTWASARGSLTREVIAAVWAAGAAPPRTTEIVASVWREVASRRPGDPASLSAFLNARSASEMASLRAEVADLVDDFREVWPPLPADVVLAQVRRPVEVRIADGLVRLRTTPDLVLDSPHDDDRARSLLVEVTTGRPRPTQRRAELRLAALCTTLATGTPPFRWATFYVPEGRWEAEDLATAPLEDATRQVHAVLAQHLRVRSADPTALRLQAGAWCAECRRVSDCPVAAAAGQPMSHQGGTIGPRPQQS